MTSDRELSRVGASLSIRRRHSPRSVWRSDRWGSRREPPRGEPREAQKHLTTARTMYREVGMNFWLEEAETEPGPGS
jgi:hypothetical protein